MEFLLQIIEISPSISQLKTNNNVIYILFFDNKGLENIFDLEEIFNKNSPISLKLSNFKQKIKICLQINDKIFGECDFIPFNNDTKVINIINSGLKNYNFNGTKINSIKIKIKSIFNEVFYNKKKSQKNINIVKKPSNNIKMKYLTSSPINVCKQKTSKNMINKNIFEKKKNSSNSIYNLKYNNSCEEILNTSKNFIKNSYREIMNKNRKKMLFDEISNFSNNNLSINQNLYNSMIFKNVPNNKRNSSIKLKCKMRSTGNSETKKSNKKNYNSMINSQIYNNKNKFHNKNESFSLRAFIKNSIFTENNVNNNNKINLEEKYKSIEETLIDKNLENDLLNDENLISNKKILTSLNNNQNNNNNINNFNLNISLNSRSNNLIVTREETNQNSFNSFSDENENKKNNIKNNFYELKNDFEIFYTDDYINNIKDDLLKLEINLIFEKIFEIQKSYHFELKNYQINNKFNNKNFNNILEKFLILQKKNQKLKNEIEKSFYCQNNLSEKNQKNFDIIKTNKNEIDFWKKFSVNFFMKDKLKDLFKKIVFEKIDNYKNKLDNVENIIIEKLMIKYKYKKNNNNNNNNNINHSQRNNNRTNSLIKNNYFSINQNKLNNNNNNKILFTTTSKNPHKKLPNFKKN